jgi:ABC-type oligopeptide transport system ATPase subunit
MTIPPNRTIALVGESGAGKTTVFNLISRFYDPDEGSAIFEGQNLTRLIRVRLMQLLYSDMFLLYFFLPFAQSGFPISICSLLSKARIARCWSL